MVQAPPPLGPLHWWVRSVRVGGRDESEDPIAGGKMIYLITMINKINKQKLPRRGKADWLDWTRLDWTQDIDDPTYDNKPTRNCKHKEIINGANEEGNEGEQLGKFNQ